MSKQEGLSVPNSAILEKDVIKVPKDYLTTGSNSSKKKFLNVQTIDENGNMSIQQIAPTIYNSDDTYYYVNPADFAAGAVALLDQLGVVTHLCFGSEMGESERFMETAAILADESDSFSAKLKEGLSEGLSWPQARVRALEAEGISDLGNFLETPNNLLGVEYCKALIRQKSPIQPITILRKGNGYHSQDLTGELASASAIRREIFKEEPDFSILLSQVPDEIRSLFKAEVPLQPEDLSDLLNYRLLTLKRDGIPFSVFADVSNDLSDRLESKLYEQADWEERIRQLKSRQYTYTRISRCLLHILLGITDEMVLAGKEAGFSPYTRILGFRKSKAGVLSEIKKHTRIPLVTKTADASRMLSGTAKMLFEQDLYASHVRQSLLSGKTGQPVRNEFTQPICII